jgi:hypothetical protein
MGLVDFFRQKNAYGGDQSGAMAGMSPGYSNPNLQPFSGTQDIPQAPPDALAPPPDDSGYGQGDMDTSPVITDTSRSTRDTDALRDLAGQYPNREDYKPSILRRIGAGFVGYNEGSRAASAYKDAPYNDAVTDWSNKIKPAENIANLERYGNTDATRGAYQQGSLAIRQGESDRKKTADEQRYEVAKDKLVVSHQRADDAQRKIDAVIKNNNLTASEKATLTQKFQKDLIAARADAAIHLQTLRGAQKTGQIAQSGDIRKDIEDLRSSNAADLVGARGEQARQTKAAPGSAGSTPTQQRTGIMNRAGQLAREHPEWADHVTIDTNTQQVKVAPTGTFSGPDAKTRAAIMQYLNGTGDNGTQGQTAPKGPPTANKTEPGYIAVADSTGKVVAQIPVGDVEKLDKTKYHVVK